MAKMPMKIKLLLAMALFLLGTGCAPHYGVIAPRSTQEVRLDKLWEYYETDLEGNRRAVEMEIDVISG